MYVCRLCMYVCMYVCSFNDIMMTNRNMIQYRIDKHYECRVVRLNLCKTLGIKYRLYQEGESYVFLVLDLSV